ncbi:helix-turn-helix domain-containing protein [Paenibacillus lutrae]|nr:helix-turn-helix domain-containing protein [Paenibacillus lutrae]
MNREELSQLVNEHILAVPEVIKELGITNQALSSLIERGKLMPIKKVGRTRLFLRQDVEERKQEATLLKEKYRPFD